MARAVQQGQVTPADELRDLLTAAEKRVANVRGSGEGAVLLLRELDRIAELWPQLTANGVDLRPEEGRWETLQASVRKRAASILNELRSNGGIEALRERTHPAGTDAEWWRLDAVVKEQQRLRLRRTAIGMGAVTAIGVILFFALRWLFPVDPKVQEALRRIGLGEQAVQQSGDWQTALAEFQAASELIPNDYDAWFRLGVAYEQTGNAQAAEAAFARARELLNSELEFHKGRAGAYLTFDLVDAADKDIQAALALKYDDPQAWYQAASVFEARRQIPEAIDALEKAGTYAAEARMTELEALSRYRMGVLMQQMSMPQEPLTPAPVP